ncbi:MAG: MOSC domain-containing protein [Actinomycetia bacterium]|nr:MOSC domain-containing protein [Actinomycetes bacterium]
MEHVVIGGRAHTIRWATRHAVHDLWHHLIDIASIGVALGRGASTKIGTVEQINRSPGGVPKVAVAEAEISWSGVDGDTQRARAHHGRPWQALCLWSGDVIDALVAEGHPISAGAAGENITIRGWDWSRVRAGLVVDIAGMRAQISAPTVPCAKINQWFADGDSRRVDNDLYPGWSRWYASVLTSGPIRAGDAVTLGSPL